MLLLLLELLGLLLELQQACLGLQEPWLRRLVRALHPLLQSQRSWLCCGLFHHDVYAAFSPESLSFFSLFPLSTPKTKETNQRVQSITLEKKTHIKERNSRQKEKT